MLKKQSASCTGTAFFDIFTEISIICSEIIQTKMLVVFVNSYYCYSRQDLHLG
jgi:hypothetical protein